jgi:hypothetical protein
MLKAQMVLVLACVGLALPGRAYAQTSLVNLMHDVFVNEIVVAPTPGGKGIVAHTGDFKTDPALIDVTNLIDQVSRQISSQVATFPLGSSSGGFTYTFDPSLGTFSRSTVTFGPAFAERAATVGRRKLNVGMNYEFGSYGSLDGKDIQNGEINFYLLHQKLTPPSFVEGDVIKSGLNLNLTSNTTVFYANYGVTNDLDIGLALPVSHVSMDLTYHSTILQFATHATAPQTHLFVNGTTTQDFSASGSATGIGDVVVRAKYAFRKRETQDLAVGLDLRFPTGDDQNMLGTGTTQASFFFIASTIRGNFAPHVNVGYTVSGSSASDQVNYVGGVEYAVSPRLTVIGDLLGRTYLDSLRIEDTTVQHQFQQSDTAPVETTPLAEIIAVPKSLTTLLGTVGVKVNVWQNLLVSAHVLVALDNAGLISRVRPVIGVDYSF